MSGSGLATVPDVREWSGYPSGYPEVVRKHSQMSESGRESLPNVQEWSRISARCLGVVGRPSWMSWSGRESLPDVRQMSGDPLDVREALPVFPECLVDPPGCPGVPTGCPGAPTGCPVLLNWPSRMSETGWEGILDVR